MAISCFFVNYILLKVYLYIENFLIKKNHV
jgi:hypothetical protein